MDEFDRAQEINEEFQADKLAEQLAKVTAGISKMYCEDCEEPIPQARRHAMPGCTRCVTCQAQHEQQELLAHWRG